MRQRLLALIPILILFWWALLTSLNEEEDIELFIYEEEVLLEPVPEIPSN